MDEFFSFRLPKAFQLEPVSQDYFNFLEFRDGDDDIYATIPVGVVSNVYS